MYTERAIHEKKYPASEKGYPCYGVDADPSCPPPIRLIGKRHTEKKTPLSASGARGRERHFSDMEELKTFAGGIAHNFNNMLMGINGHVELMLLESPTVYARSLTKIKELIFQGSSEIYRFLEAACGKVLPPAMGRRIACTGSGLRDGRKMAVPVKGPAGAESGAETSQRLREMADGLVGDLNTVLHDIQGIITLILANISDDHLLYPSLKKVENLVTKGAEMTCQLLHCTRGSGMNSQPVRLDCLIKEAVDTFCGIREGINVHFSLPQKPVDIIADPCQIEQVLQNLYLNAADAMPHGGDLFLETTDDVVQWDAKRVSAEAVKPRYVRVSVRDTGSGMDPEIARHIFEPFFSTKSLKGRGLGLASADRTVQAHGGYIEVDSSPGCGTTFMIYLPTNDPPAPGVK